MTYMGYSLSNQGVNFSYSCLNVSFLVVQTLIHLYVTFGDSR